jgi:glycosyltransferase involved in cell wall biosynthesis
VLAIAPNVIVIDDGSTDATVERIADLPVTLIRHDQPLGKGQGLRDGFRKALELGFDAVIAMDGDGQHLASDIPRMLAAARAYPEHIVIGARIRNKENQPPARRRANAVADWGISWGCGVPISDTQSGQRYYPRAALDLADLEDDDFVFEAALLIAATRERSSASSPCRSTRATTANSAAAISARCATCRASPGTRSSASRITATSSPATAPRIRHRR